MHLINTGVQEPVYTHNGASTLFLVLMDRQNTNFNMSDVCSLECHCTGILNKRPPELNSGAYNYIDVYLTETGQTAAGFCLMTVQCHVQVLRQGGQLQIESELATEH